MSAAKAFPLYRDSLLNKGESYFDIDWDAIKGACATKKLFRASDRDVIGKNHPLNKKVQPEWFRHFALTKIVKYFSLEL